MSNMTKSPGHDTDSRRATLGAGVHRIYLPAPVDAHARAEMQTGLSPRLQSDSVGPLYGYAMEVHASTQSERRHRPASTTPPSTRCSRNGLTKGAFIASVRHLAEQHHLDLNILHGDGTNTIAKKGGDGIGYSGHKHQTGEKIIAIVDNNGYVLAPLPVAPVNETDTGPPAKGIEHPEARGQIDRSENRRLGSQSRWRV